MEGGRIPAQGAGVHPGFELEAAHKRPDGQILAYFDVSDRYQRSTDGETVVS